MKDVFVLRRSKLIDHEKLSIDRATKMGFVPESSDYDANDFVWQNNEACREVLEVHVLATTKKCFVCLKPNRYNDTEGSLLSSTML